MGKYSLEDQQGKCLHRESYPITKPVVAGTGVRRCIDAGDGKEACGYQFAADDEWKKAKRAALAFEKAGA